MKQIRKQIEANLRNKMVKGYNDKLSNLQENQLLNDYRIV